MDEEWHKYRLLGEQAAQGGNYVQAEAMWAMAALIAQGFAAKDPRFAFSLDNLGQVLARQGKFPLAEYVLGRSWQTKTQGNVSQIEAARTLNIVSELYFYQKRFEESEQLISRVLSVYQTIYGQDHSHTVEVARNLTMIQQARIAAGPTASSAYHNALPASAVAAAAVAAGSVQGSQAEQNGPAGASPAGQSQPQAASNQPPPSNPSMPAIPANPANAGMVAGGGQSNPATSSYTQAPAIPSPNPNPGKPLIAMSRASSSFKTKCELCGYEIEGEWCGRCTGTSLKAISPENRLK
jgi:hypothetical protein